MRNKLTINGLNQRTEDNSCKEKCIANEVTVWRSKKRKRVQLTEGNALNFAFFRFARTKPHNSNDSRYIFYSTRIYCLPMMSWSPVHNASLHLTFLIAYVFVLWLCENDPSLRVCAYILQQLLPFYWIKRDTSACQLSARMRVEENKRKQQTRAAKQCATHFCAPTFTHTQKNERTRVPPVSSRTNKMRLLHETSDNWKRYLQLNSLCLPVQIRQRFFLLSLTTSEYIVHRKKNPSRKTKLKNLLFSVYCIILFDHFS